MPQPEMHAQKPSAKQAGLKGGYEDMADDELGFVPVCQDMFLFWFHLFLTCVAEPIFSSPATAP